MKVLSSFDASPFPSRIYIPIYASPSGGLMSKYEPRKTMHHRDLNKVRISELGLRARCVAEP